MLFGARNEGCSRGAAVFVGVAIAGTGIDSSSRSMKYTSMGDASGESGYINVS